MNTDLLEIAQELFPKYGRDFPIRKGAIPKLVLLMFGPMINKNFIRRFVPNNINIAWKADHWKIKKELNISFRPMLLIIFF